jgi:hypothetical protein
MADTGLKIVIGADIGAAVTGIGRLTDTMAGIAPAATQAVAGLNRIPASLRPINPAQMQSLNAAVQRLRQDLTSMPRNPLATVATGANQATQALTNVGRVAQDLPFGFIGIANNLNPLLESFQRLRAETGSNRAAFSALGKSLMGAGGIGLALSVVSSAFLIFGSSMRGAKKELEGFDKAIDDANKKAGDEIARVQVLNAVITDNTRTQTERKKAAKELSDILKEQNINMSQEAILNGKVAEATKLATAAIIERAKARAIEARIGELSGQQLQRDLKKANLTDKLTQAQKAYNAEIAKRGQNRNKDQIEEAGLNQFNALSKITDLKDDIHDLDKETAKANKEIAFLVGQIKSTDLTLDLKGGNEKEVDLLKQRIAALKELQGLTGLDIKQRVELAQLEIQLAKRDGVKAGFTKAEIQQQITGILEQAFPVKTFEFDTIVTTRVNKLEPSFVKDAKALTDSFKTDIAKAINPSGKPIEIPMPPVTLTDVNSKLADINQALKDQVRGIFENGLTDVFAGLGEGFGEAIATADFGGALKKAAQNILSIVGGVMQQLGRALIAAAIKIKLLKEAFEKFLIANPVLAIIAGVTLIAAGAALKNIKFDGPKFAEGGIVSGPMIGQVGERFRPEVVLPLDRLPQLFKQIGGDVGGGIQLIPIINNEGLYLAMKRGERSAGRKF